MMKFVQCGLSTTHVAHSLTTVTAGVVHVDNHSDMPVTRRYAVASCAAFSMISCVVVSLGRADSSL